MNRDGKTASCPLFALHAESASRLLQQIAAYRESQTVRRLTVSTVAAESGTEVKDGFYLVFRNPYSVVYNAEQGSVGLWLRHNLHRPDGHTPEPAGNRLSPGFA